MITIKIKNKKIKLFNLLLVMFILLLVIYVILKLFFLLPIFTKKYSYKSNYEFYEVNNNVKFKSSILSCKVIEEKDVSIINKNIKNTLSRDLISDGFVKKSNLKYVRKNKYFGFCKKYLNKYKKEYNNSYVKLKLNGKSKEKINVLENYIDPYVEFKIDDKVSNNISVSSNLNTNKAGLYIISYTLNVSADHNERLYRIIKVIDDEKPVINLIGDEKIVLEYNQKYEEPGYNAIDNLDGDITNKVKVENNVDIKKAGTYEIIYKVKDDSKNEAIVKRQIVVNNKQNVKKEQKEEKNTGPKIEEKDGITYVNGILVVNKKYGLPKDYAPGVNEEAYKALKTLQADAKAINLSLGLASGYRSYETQEKLYNNYVKKDGKELADTYSAMPGHSEHQTGLAFDVGYVSEDFAYTDEAKWLAENAHLYGFIIRYPKGKTNITGYIYEPWHIRYLGVDIATKVKESGLTLEEYLKIN